MKIYTIDEPEYGDNRKYTEELKFDHRMFEQQRTVRGIDEQRHRVNEIKRGKGKIKTILISALVLFTLFSAVAYGTAEHSAAVEAAESCGMEVEERREGTFVKDPMTGTLVPLHKALKEEGIEIEIGDVLDELFSGERGRGK